MEFFLKTHYKLFSNYTRFVISKPSQDNDINEFQGIWAVSLV